MVDINESAIISSHCENSNDMETATTPIVSRDDIEENHNCDDSLEKDASDEMQESDENNHNGKQMYVRLS